MATENMTTYVDMLKEFYTPKHVQNMVYKKNQLLATLPKAEDKEGETWDTPIIIADPQAGSVTFSVAQGNKGPISTDKFQLTAADDYSFGSISRKLIKATKTNKGAFLPAAKVHIDGAVNTATRSRAIQLFGDGSGAKAQAASFSTDTITLTNRHDAVKFQKGEVIQLAANADKTGAAVRGGSPGTATILAVNRTLGTLQCTATVSTVITSPTALDWIYRAGDYDGALVGLDGWLPSTTPTTSLFGVDRTVDPEMLGGVRLDRSGSESTSVIEALIDICSEVFTVGGGEVDHIFLHPSQLRALSKSELARVEKAKFEITDNIGFRGFTLTTDMGEARIMGDRYCPYDRAYALQLDTWELGSLGPCVDIFDRDSDQEMLREASTDGYEVRIGGYAQLSCNAPGFNGVVLLDAQS